MTGWLPVFHRINKTTTAQKHCPYCPADETIAHLFQCPSKALWRSSFQHNLQKQLLLLSTPHKIQEQIQTAIMDRLHQVQQYTHFSEFTCFAGLFPKQWRYLMRTTMTSDNYKQVQQWHKKFGRWMIEQGYDLWSLPNKKVHEDSPLPSTIHTILNQQIKSIYELQSEVSPHDTAIFDISIEDRYQLTEKQKRVWIERTTHTVSKSIEEKRTKLQTGQKKYSKIFS